MGLSFDGVDDYAFNNSLIVSQPYTVACWVLCNDTANLQTVFGYANATTGTATHYRELRCAGSAANDPITAAAAQGGAADSASVGTYLQQTWCRVAAVFNANNLRLAYFNGTSDNATINRNVVGLDVATVGATSLNASITRYFTGTMAHLQLWNRRLFTDEIEAALWNPGAVSRGLQGYYPLFNNALDFSGNERHLTLVGPTVVPGMPPAGNPYIRRRANLWYSAFVSTTAAATAVDEASYIFSLA